MPLFEVDTQRPLLVTSASGANGSEPGLKTTANQVVDSHIDGLLGEEVFPIAQGSGPDEPHLLALDASGSPVVVRSTSPVTTTMPLIVFASFRAASRA